MSDVQPQVLSDQHKSLFESFLQQYKALAGILNSLPFHPNFKDKVIHYFDTGFLWAREAMNILQIAQKLVDDKKAEEQKPAVVEAVLDVEQPAA